MQRIGRGLALAALFATAPANAAGLPDTGLTTCFTDGAADAVPASDAASVSRDAGTFPRQDCRYGRDPAAAAGDLIKTGAGAKGLDYTKIANNGAAITTSAILGTGATDWACTRDNVTGLTWEVKTATNTDLRYAGHTYTWYNPDAGSNGGDAGVTGPGFCGGTLPPGCNTAAYIAAVNAANLCGHGDWRLPSPRELSTLSYADGTFESVDTSYFPNVLGSQYWTPMTNAADPTQAWGVNRNSASFILKTGSIYVWVVRGGPF